MSGVGADSHSAPIGHVVEVHGPVVDIACESLAAENRQRLAHMEHALNRVDETVASLALERNALRQGQIVEEIEVILSSEQAFLARAVANGAMRSDSGRR